MKSISLTNLSGIDVQTILNALSNLPYNQVANLIERVRSEAQAQIDADIAAQTEEKSNG